MAKREFGIGVIGFGSIGKMHSYAYAVLPFYYGSLDFSTRLRAVCTARPETAAAAKARAGFEKATTDPYALIEDSDIDIVHICTPNDTHADYAVAALRAGKHVYCEKPLARSLGEAEAMRDAAIASGCVHQVAFQYRFIPAIMRAKELIEEGFLGDVWSFRLRYLHSSYIRRERPMSWRLDAERSGGGALHDLGSHVIDLLLHLVGGAQSVFATTHTFIESRPVTDGSEERASVTVDDLALLQVALENGALGTVEASRIATGATNDLIVELHGDKGALRFDLMDANWLDAFDGRAEGGPTGGRIGYTRIQTVQCYPEPAGFPSRGAAPGWTRFHVASLFDFLSNVVAERVGHPSFEDGLAVQRVLDAAQRSAAAREWVSLGDAGT